MTVRASRLFRGPRPTATQAAVEVARVMALAAMALALARALAHIGYIVFCSYTLCLRKHITDQLLLDLASVDVKI